jgi:hypothetical protein
VWRKRTYEDHQLFLVPGVGSVCPVLYVTKRLFDVSLLECGRRTHRFLVTKNKRINKNQTVKIHNKQTKLTQPTCTCDVTQLTSQRVSGTILTCDSNGGGHLGRRLALLMFLAFQMFAIRLGTGAATKTSTTFVKSAKAIAF